MGRDYEKAVTLLNIKGRVVKIKNDKIKGVRLPTAKRKKEPNNKRRRRLAVQNRSNAGWVHDMNMAVLQSHLRIGTLLMPVCKDK